MSSEPTMILPMERRYRNPGYVPLPGAHYRAFLGIASGSLSYLLFGLAAGTFFGQPVNTVGWNFLHGLAAAGAVLGFAIIVASVKNEPKREIDAIDRRLFLQPQAVRIFSGLGMSLTSAMTDEQIAQAVELKWKLDALDRSQHDGIGDGYEANRTALIDQIKLTLYGTTKGN